jgi:hypothetical protein
MRDIFSLLLTDISFLTKRRYIANLKLKINPDRPKHRVFFARAGYLSA